MIDRIAIIFKFLSARHFPWDLLCQDWGLWREIQFLPGSLILVTGVLSKHQNPEENSRKLDYNRDSVKTHPKKGIPCEAGLFATVQINTKFKWGSNIPCWQNFLSREQHQHGLGATRLVRVDAVPSNFPQLRILSSANIFRIISPSAPPRPIGHNAGYSIDDYFVRQPVGNGLKSWFSLFRRILRKRKSLRSWFIWNSNFRQNNVGTMVYISKRPARFSETIWFCWKNGHANQL